MVVFNIRVEKTAFFVFGSKSYTATEKRSESVKMRLRFTFKNPAVRCSLSTQAQYYFWASVIIFTCIWLPKKLEV